MAAHPNVKINIRSSRTRRSRPSSTTRCSRATCPTCSSRGAAAAGREQVEAGLVKDITADIASWKDTINAGALGMYEVDGKQYGMPFNLGLVGFWYNKALRGGRDHDAARRRGTSSSPTSKTSRTRASPRSPSPARTSGPAQFYWAYLRVRNGGQAGMDKAVTDRRLDRAVLRQGRRGSSRSSIDLEPFQEGFLAAPWDGAGSGAAAQATARRPWS